MASRRRAHGRQEETTMTATRSGDLPLAGRDRSGDKKAA